MTLDEKAPAQQVKPETDPNARIPQAHELPRGTQHAPPPSTKRTLAAHSSLNRLARSPTTLPARRASSLPKFLAQSIDEVDGLAAGRYPSGCWQMSKGRLGLGCGRDGGSKAQSRATGSSGSFAPSSTERASPFGRDGMS